MLQEENILIYFALNRVGSKSAVLTSLEPSIYPKNWQCQNKFLLQLWCLNPPMEGALEESDEFSGTPKIHRFFFSMI